MKHTTLLLVMLCFGFSAMANTVESGNNLARLVRLLPDRVTPSIIKDMFGEAAIITINNRVDEQTWQYADETNLIVRWDMKKEELKFLSFSSHNISKQNWSNDYLSHLEMGRSTLRDVVNLLGYPKDLTISPGENKMKYIYADNSVDFQFKNGVLSNVQVWLTQKKKSGDVSVSVY